MLVRLNLERKTDVVSETDVATENDRRFRRQHGGPDGQRGDSGSLLVQEGDIAADYLERLLDIIDYDGDIDLDVENDRAVVAIVGDGLQALVGPQGVTLDALQELTRLAVQQRTGMRSRLMLDVSGHRAARREALGALATRTGDEVLASGTAVRMDPMNPFERKISSRHNRGDRWRAE